jgi:hypothetical protein
MMQHPQSSYHRFVQQHSNDSKTGINAKCLLRQTEGIAPANPANAATAINNGAKATATTTAQANYYLDNIPSTNDQNHRVQGRKHRGRRDITILKMKAPKEVKARVMR